MHKPINGGHMHALVMIEPSPGPDRTEVRQLPEPHPGVGQVSIDVCYAGINFIDVMARRGDPGYATSWPCVPGLEVAGTIGETGSSVRVCWRAAGRGVHPWRRPARNCPG